MKNEVRPSRKEQRRQRTAHEQQTYERHKAASRKRSATVRDWDHIFRKHGVPEPAELWRVIEALLVEFRDGGITDYAAAIFNPRLDDLKKLPVGVLDHKEERLPFDLIPDTKDALRAHCERMIIRNRNRALVTEVIDGWPGEGFAQAKLDRHIDDLWTLRSVNADLYRALVSGRHRILLPYLWRDQPPRPFSRAQFRHMLICQGLLWCTNDIQLILARNALAERNPFGAFIVSKKRKLEPSRIVNDLRGHLVLLRLLLNLYATTAEEEAGEKTIAQNVPEDPLAQRLERQIKVHAGAQGIDLMALRSRLDVMAPYLQGILARGGKRFRQELERSPTSQGLSKHFHGIWFSGLSNVGASAIPILRYLQAEAGLGELLDELAPEKDGAAESRESLALPAFHTSRLRRPWLGRAQSLLRLYRRELLDDADFDSLVEPGEAKGESDFATWKQGRPALTAASKRLQAWGDRRITDHHGDEHSRGRTFYLLDIIPEARLAT